MQPLSPSLASWGHSQGAPTPASIGNNLRVGGIAAFLGADDQASPSRGERGREGPNLARPRAGVHGAEHKAAQRPHGHAHTCPLKAVPSHGRHPDHAGGGAGGAGGGKSRGTRHEAPMHGRLAAKGHADKPQGGRHGTKGGAGAGGQERGVGEPTPAALEALSLFSPRAFEDEAVEKEGGGEGAAGQRGSAASVVGIYDFTVNYSIKCVKINDGLDFQRQSLREIDLSGDDLKGAKFVDSNLTRAKLCKTDMSTGVLRGCKFKEAEMIEWLGHNTDATGCIFNFANMHRAQMTQAKSHRASFRGSKMQEADLSSSDLSASDFTSFDRRHITEMHGINLQRSIVFAANLSGVRMKGGLCQDAVFSGSSFSGAALESCNMEGAKLQLCDFQGANLNGTSFHRADLSAANFSGADVSGCNFCGADLRGVRKDGVLNWDRCLTDYRTLVTGVHLFEEKSIMRPPPLPPRLKKWQA